MVSLFLFHISIEKIKEEDKNGRIFKTGTDMDKET